MASTMACLLPVSDLHNYNTQAAFDMQCWPLWTSHSHPCWQGPV